MLKAERVTQSGAGEHYSYTVYADPATARAFDDRHFGGPIGALIADDQATVLADFVGRIGGRTILDVGTGTGRVALFFASGGARVTAVDWSEAMLDVARQRAADRLANVQFVRGDAHALDFPDRAFEVGVSLRVVMHASSWRTCISELCRVADRLVILDYPSRRSLALVHAAVRRVAHRFGVRTQPYRVFSDWEIAQALERSGFRVRSVHRQFVLPIALHKLIGSPRLTLVVEHWLERAGLLKIFGSPVTLVAERWKFS